MITILILTYNRPDYLKRILSYYSDYQIAYNIIVADSSSDENKQLNRGAISSFSNINISHINNYPSETNPYGKLAHALNYVDTKYCVLCADDDFITPNGINQSVDFLEHNPDFTVAHGRYISFRLESDGTEERFCWKPIYLPPGIKTYRKPADTLRRLNTESSIAFADAEERLRYHLSNYFMPTVYAVHRTDFLKLIVEEAVKFTSDYQFAELLCSMLTLIHGKMKCLDVLYAARDADSVRSVYLPSLEHLVKVGRYDEEYGEFRDCLEMHLSGKSELDAEASKKVIDDGMSAYMKKSYHNYKRVLLYKAEYVLDYLPDRMNKGIRALYRKLFPPWQGADPPICVDISPSSQYYDDLNNIRLHVLSHKKNRASYAKNVM